MIPNNWKKYKLGDIVELNYGKSLTSTTRIPGSIPVYSSAGITGSHNKALVNSEAIIVGRKGSIGTVYLTKVPFYCIDTAYYILPNKQYDLVYLYYLLQNLGLDKLNSDSAVPGLNRDEAYSQEITLPPLPEQQAIAEILSSLDDKIELNLQMNKTLEEMANALYKHWFVDFGPFKDGKFVESELGMIPEGWEVSTFKNLVGFIIDNRGKTPPISPEIDKYLMIETTQLTNRNLFPELDNIEKNKYVSELVYNTRFRKGHPQYLDILFATVGNGIPNWAFAPDRDDICIAQNLIAIRADKNIATQSFLKYSFDSKLFLEQFDGYVITTAQPSIKISDLNLIKMLLPPLHLIIEWDKIITDLIEKQFNNFKEIQTLKQTRDYLLPKLISGEVRVKDLLKQKSLKDFASANK